MGSYFVVGVQTQFVNLSTIRHPCNHRVRCAVRPFGSCDAEIKRSAFRLPKVHYECRGARAGLLEKRL